MSTIESNESPGMGSGPGNGATVDNPDAAATCAEVPRGEALVATPEQRFARGRAARQATPRSSHGMLEPLANRPDPIALLEEQAQSRVPELVPIRHGRMLASPFAFYRGGALIMASDLAGTPRTGLTVQLCGHPISSDRAVPLC